MGSRIYVVSSRATDEVVYVRAKTLSAAIRSVADARFEARAASTEDVYLAMREGCVVMDAMEPDGESADDSDPGPVPEEIPTLRVAK